ncbi:MAG: hypothetical protein AAF483_02405 [Planctomycetota bacterium]
MTGSIPVTTKDGSGGGRQQHFTLCYQTVFMTWTNAFTIFTNS